MNLIVKIQSHKHSLSGISLISTETFFSEELTAQLTGWNDELTKHRASLAELGQEAATLIDSATSGECSRPAGIITDLAKVSQKLKRLQIETINLLSAKRFLWPLVQDGYRQHNLHWKKKLAARNAELEKVTAGMVKATKAQVTVTDPQRKEFYSAMLHCNGQLQHSKNILSNAELQLLEDLQLSFQDLF